MQQYAEYEIKRQTYLEWQVHMLLNQLVILTKFQESNSNCSKDPIRRYIVAYWKAFYYEKYSVEHNRTEFGETNGIMDKSLKVWGDGGQINSEVMLTVQSVSPRCFQPDQSWEATFTRISSAERWDNFDCFLRPGMDTESSQYCTRTGRGLPQWLSFWCFPN